MTQTDMVTELESRAEIPRGWSLLFKEYIRRVLTERTLKKEGSDSTACQYV